MADIFISYAREDKPDAERLALALRAQGFKVRWDVLPLRSGQAFSASIQRVLEEATRVLVLWSATSVTSRQLDAEARWARARGKLHSVWLDDSSSVPSPFNTSNARSLASWDGGSEHPELRYLVADIAAFAHPRRAPGSAPTALRSRSYARAGTPWLRSAMVGGLLLLLGLGVLAVVLVVWKGAPPEVATEQPPVSQRPAESSPVTERALVAEPTVEVGVSRGPWETFRDCKQCPQMVVIPSGSFQMGSAYGEGDSDEHPRHDVRIGKAFAIGKMEITFDQWDACVQAGACNQRPEDQGWGRGNRPVIHVSWQDAREYTEWLGTETGKSYRLPTEAEWEYAARAGTQTPFSTGDCISTAQANYNGSIAWKNCPVSSVFRNRTVEVGTLAPNPWGLYEMHGNVWEWVQDCWHANYAAAPNDGSAMERGDCRSRVLRGGGWDLGPGNLRSANRGGAGADKRDLYVAGFRVVRDNP